MGQRLSIYLFASVLGIPEPDGKEGILSVKYVKLLNRNKLPVVFISMCYAKNLQCILYCMSILLRSKEIYRPPVLAFILMYGLYIDAHFPVQVNMQDF